MSEALSRGERRGDKGGQTSRTPRFLAKWIVARFVIDLDACAETHNAIVPRFIGPPGHRSFLEGSSLATLAPQMVAEDAFAAWTIWERHGSSIFCNPPFAQRKDAYTKAREAFKDGARVVLLGPDEVSSSFFRPLLEARPSTYRFVSPGNGRTGRLAYEGVFADDPYKRPAFGSALVVLDGLGESHFVDVASLEIVS